jgi:hypothetical protein
MMMMSKMQQDRSREREISGQTLPAIIIIAPTTINHPSKQRNGNSTFSDRGSADAYNHFRSYLPTFTIQHTTTTRIVTNDDDSSSSGFWQPFGRKNRISGSLFMMVYESGTESAIGVMFVLITVIYWLLLKEITTAATRRRMQTSHHTYLHPTFKNR